MSATRDIRRQLDQAWRAVEALDADLAAGRIDDATHARERAEREREAGRLFVSLRRAQAARGVDDRSRSERGATKRDALEQDGASAWWRKPIVLAPGAVLLLAGGILAGVVLGKRPVPVSTGTATTAPTGTAPATASPTAVTGVDREALRQAASRDDAPIESLLRFGHVLLDEGRTAEARAVYERAVAREPRNPEAITHLGAVLYQEGNVDGALAKVDEALRVDARYVHALWDRAQYLFQSKRDYPAAIKAAEAFIDVAGPGPDADAARQLIADARARLKSAGR